jgi:hypothetical protein
VTAPKGFGIALGLRARRMLVHEPPDARTESEDVDLARDETREGLPAELRPGETYEAVVIEKRLAGDVRSARE